jgi:zinc finger MYND domain-containing protein 10
MPPEAEQLIEQLKEQAVDMVGSSRDWMAYHHTIEKLNLQAHQSAQRKQDNFVVESLVTYQKFPILVTNLLSVEMWKASVFPLLTCQDDEVASLRLYYIVSAKSLVAINL